MPEERIPVPLTRLQMKALVEVCDAMKSAVNFRADDFNHKRPVDKDELYDWFVEWRKEAIITIGTLGLMAKAEAEGELN